MDSYRLAKHFVLVALVYCVTVRASTTTAFMVEMALTNSERFYLKIYTSSYLSEAFMNERPITPGFQLLSFIKFLDVLG